MAEVTVIAEMGSAWRGWGDEKENARRMIRAAKDCGANIVKQQWCSDGAALASRRGLGADAAAMYKRYLEWPKEWMQEFKAFADECGIEWLCTVFLPADVAVVAPLLKRFKVAAKESRDKELAATIMAYERPVIVSNPNWQAWSRRDTCYSPIAELHCVSKYPCPIDEIGLSALEPWDSHDTSVRGLSDHTGHVLTGAVAVGAGARCLEVHFMLDDTPKDNPDACGHSHVPSSLVQYIANVRLAERML